MLRHFAALVVFFFSAVASASPHDFDAYISRAMKTFEVPGMAVAVVKDGKVVLAKGYGVRKLGAPALVDGHTLFGIASNTKVFTATALALLVEEGKLAWDKPVINYLPWFAMYDAWVTREITIRDLLVHRSGLGLGAGDLLWWPQSNYDRKEVARRIRYIKPTTSFRSAYAYHNVLYIVAGEVVEAVSGQKWEDFVETRIFKKVGMTHSNTRHTSKNTGTNSAFPHGNEDGVARQIQPLFGEPTNPAASILSCAEDMAKWMLVLLNEGKLQTASRLFSAETWKELSNLVVPTPARTFDPQLTALTPTFSGYALGLAIQDYRGHKVISHGGSLPGYVSRVYMVPDQSLGIAVLTNQEVHPAHNSVIFHIVDTYLNAPKTDWIERFQNVRIAEQSKAKERDKETLESRSKTSRPSLPLKEYARVYDDDWYGKIVVALEDDKLVVRFGATPSLVGDMEHWQYDTFVVKWRNRELKADALISFALNAAGKIDHATMKALSPDTDFSFDFHDLYLKPSLRS